MAQTLKRVDFVRLQRENERQASEIRALKTRLGRIAGLRWSPDSAALIQRFVEALARLEDDADPAKAIVYDAEKVSTGKHQESPDLSAGIQAHPRRRLSSFRRQIDRLIVRYLDDEPESEDRPTRPSCDACNRRGNIGDVVCPRGCGPYNVPKETAA